MPSSLRKHVGLAGWCGGSLPQFAAGHTRTSPLPAEIRKMRSDLAMGCCHREGWDTTDSLSYSKHLRLTVFEGEIIAADND
jgi:hypothetical protein